MKILVTGANGVLGIPLTEFLQKQGHQVWKVSRTRQGEAWLTWDLNQTIELSQQLEILIHTAPIWLLHHHVASLAKVGVWRIVAFSSTSALSKVDSADAKERNLASLLKQGERDSIKAAQDIGIKITIFRPTMIYGYGRDQNISTISRFIRRFGFFPLAGASMGKRQPIHVDDLVAAVLAVLDNSATYGKTYNLVGAETLAYREMVSRIFHGLGKRERIITLPIAMYRGLLRGLAWFKPGLSAMMVDRMNSDLCFNSEDGAKDFNFSSSTFLTDPERDLLIH